MASNLPPAPAASFSTCLPGTGARLKSTLWLFNIAMENPQNKWRFIAGKTIYFD